MNMYSFYIDKIGNNADEKKDKISVNDCDNGDDFLNDQKIDLFEDLPQNLELKKNSTPKNLCSLNNTYFITNYKELNKKISFSNTDKILEKSVIQHGFEKSHVIPSEKKERSLKLKRKKLREKTKGKEWFNMGAGEITEEVKIDFELLKMRSVFDKKRVYKKNDITRMPKYFQVGKVIESPADFYGGRISKSQGKRTIVEELLEDAEFKKYQKKKFKEIMDENRRKKRNQIKKSTEQKKIKKSCDSKISFKFKKI